MKEKKSLLSLGHGLKSVEPEVGLMPPLQIPCSYYLEHPQVLHFPCFGLPPGLDGETMVKTVRELELEKPLIVRRYYCGGD